MVRFMRLGSVITASGRALNTAAGRQQRRAVAPVLADTADHEQLTKKNFAEVQRERHEQARHSVLISCPARINEQKFMKHLSEHGKIASHFFFEFTGTNALVEFVNIESIDSLLDATTFPEEEDTYAVPFKSRFIKVKSQEVQQQFVSGSQQSPVNINQLLAKLRDAESISEQAHVLLENNQLTEESIRLRYLVSSLVSDIATAYFPKATVHPYGSTVNSFGKMGCDLDLFLNLDSMKDVNKKDSGPFVTEYWFRRVSSPRAVQQRVLNVIGECLESFGPGCTQVQKILQARCPLVGFFHQSAGLHCDLTADNRVALRSSELLYIYGNIDSRVRPLVFALRCWARVHGITSSVPGHWITNFSLTTMILFFLQKRNPPIIPTLDKLKNLADKKDKCIIEDNDCTFVSDLSKIKPSANTESLDALLLEFMDFYGGFDFSGKCIDIRKGVEKNKPDSSPLYIQNPFERTLNISKNVNSSQLEQFVNLVQESSWILQEQMSKTSVGENKNWGLASILLSRDSKAESSLKKKQTTLRLNSLIDSLNANNKNRTTTNKKKKAEH